MPFLSLYRKYRPKLFSDIVGQEHIVKTLINSLKHNRISHAYLFAGPRGTGKTSTAKVFARALNCQNKDSFEPCGVCDSCRKIDSGKSMDVLEIDAASNRGIDEIRDLREKVKFYPTEGDYKVYIIDEVHMLTKGAFNALLKTLEEPPENVVFILATTEPHRVISTILSRCQRYDFTLLSMKDIISRLEYICNEENFEYEEKALNIIARSSNGGLRDAISILDQAISFTDKNLKTEKIQEMLGKVDERILASFIENINRNNSSEAFRIMYEQINKGKGVNRFVNDLLEYLRLILLIKECGINSGILDYPVSKLKDIEETANILKNDKIINYIEILSDVEKEIKFSSQGQLKLEMGIIKMCLAQENNLEKRVEKLEKSIKGENIREEKSILNKNKIMDEKIIDNDTDLKDNKKPDRKKAKQENINKELSMDLLRRHWSQILSKIKKDDIKAHAFIVEGKPLKIENKKIYISFPRDKDFHKRGAEKNIDIIMKGFKSELKLSLELIFISGDNLNESRKKNSKSVSPSEGNILEKDNMVEKIVKIFDGELIEARENILQK